MCVFLFKHSLDIVYKTIPKTMAETLTRKQIFYRANAERLRAESKQYYYKHREQEQERCKQYRQNNKDKIQERESKLVACDNCGEYVRCGGLARHKKTKKCVNFTNQEFKDDSLYCPLCDSIVTDKCMLKHQTSDKCRKRADLKKQCCENLIINKKIE